MKVVSTESQVTSYTLKDGDKEYWVSYQMNDGELEVWDDKTDDEIIDPDIIQKVSDAIDRYEDEQ